MMRATLWTAAVALSGAVALSPALAVWWFNEAPPVVYSTRKVLTPEVEPGGTLRIQISAEIAKVCIATVHRSIVDAEGTVYAKEPVTRPAFTNSTVEIGIPLGAAPGPAQYRARVEWNCNPLQAFFPRVVLQPELEFIILPLPEQFQLPEQQGIYIAPDAVFGLTGNP